VRSTGSQQCDGEYVREFGLRHDDRSGSSRALTCADVEGRGYAMAAHVTSHRDLRRFRMVGGGRCRRASADGWLISRTAGRMAKPLSDVARRIARVSITTPRPSSAPLWRHRSNRVRLEALRYAVNEESAQYIAVMRMFTGWLSGLLSEPVRGRSGSHAGRRGIGSDHGDDRHRLSYSR